MMMEKEKVNKNKLKGWGEKRKTRRGESSNTR
jgi:hypothetical protein